MLRILKRASVPISHLTTLYCALIRSVMEYACAVWHNAIPSHLNQQLERVQKRALRIIVPGVDYKSALSLCSITTLEERRNEICKKIFKGACEASSRLHCNIPPKRKEVHGRSLRNKEKISLPRCRTERFKRSFFPAMTFLDLTNSPNNFKY